MADSLNLFLDGRDPHRLSGPCLGTVLSVGLGEALHLPLSWVAAGDEDFGAGQGERGPGWGLGMQAGV